MEELVTQIIGYLRGMWRFRWWGLALAWVVGFVGSLAIYMPDPLRVVRRASTSIPSRFCAR